MRLIDDAGDTLEVDSDLGEKIYITIMQDGKSAVVSLTVGQVAFLCGYLYGAIEYDSK